MNRNQSKQLFLALTFSLFYTVLVFFGMRWHGLDAYSWTSSKAAFAAFLSITFLALSALAFFLLRQPVPLPEGGGTRDERMAPLRAKPILLGALFLFACWVPWIALQFPAAMTGDTYLQLIQYCSDPPVYYAICDGTLDSKYVDHHPVFDGIVFGLFVSLGNVLGSQNLGLLIYSVLQSAGTALCLSLSCFYVKRIGTPRFVPFLLLGLCAAIPLIPLSATSMIKDSLFSPFFILFFIFVIEICLTKGACLATKKNFLLFFLVIVLLCLTKKTGVYLAIGTLIVVAIFVAPFRKHALVAGVASYVLTAILIPAIVWPLIGGVAPGGKQEMLGVLFQQSVTASVEHPESLSEDDRRAINSVIDLDAAIEKFDPTIVDPVKAQFRTKCSTGDLLSYLSTYIKLGLQHPDSYAKSIGKVVIRMIAPVEHFGTHYRCETVLNNEDKALYYELDGAYDLSFEKPEELAKIDRLIQIDISNLAYEIPWFGWVSTKGLYGGLVPLLAFIVLARHRGLKETVAILSPVIISFLLLFVSPASSGRYIIPFLYVAPLLIGLIIWSRQPQIAKANVNAHD